MMKFAALALLIASASAFAPSLKAANKASLTASPFDDDIGATLPLGFFDPLGLVADGDQAKFDRLRYTEIKHGRIAMLAVVGYLFVESGARLPGYISYSEKLLFSDLPNGYAALEQMPYLGKLQLIAGIGLLEVNVMRTIKGTPAFPGDLRNGATGWDLFDPETQKRKRSIELNNGRAAMMGILALMVHEQLGVSIIPSIASTEYAF